MPTLNRQLPSPFDADRHPALPGACRRRPGKRHKTRTEAFRAAILAQALRRPSLRSNPGLPQAKPLNPKTQLGSRPERYQANICGALNKQSLQPCTNPCFAAKLSGLSRHFRLATRKTVRLRADQKLVELELAESRTKAQALILAGQVFLGDKRIEKPGIQLKEHEVPRVKERDRYVSRGGHKLEGALTELRFDVSGALCADVGASTGGFTDCLLQHGARKVYAIDVGRGLLANKLVQDERVVVMDRTNARNLDAGHFDDVLDLVVVDASFIGMSKLVDAFARIIPEGACLLAMVKPQFEVGRDAARRHKGVITNPSLRANAVQTARDSILAAGFEMLASCDATLAGPKGNIEHFVLARRSSTSQ